MKPHAFHPEAGEEYTQAVEHYATVAPELGNRFYEEIEGIIREIREEPERFFRMYPPARRALSRQFPYSVVYIDQPDRIWIVALMHAKRRPGYWRDRLAQPDD